MDKIQVKDSLQNLLEIMSRLRSENGCPWDKAQTPETLKPYLLEEAYEVIGSLDENNPDEIRNELGDLLLQIVFLSEIFKEDGHFEFNDVAQAIAEKLIRRHPHVFGDSNEENLSKLNEQWEAIKQNERKVKAHSIVGHIPNNLPALLQAQKISGKVAAVGFDWNSIDDVFEKLSEELDELKEAIAAKDTNAASDELGDLLFTVVNIGRHLNIDCETSLLQMLDRFKSRFQIMEEAVKKNGKNIDQTNLDELESLWQKAKVILASNA